MKAYIVNNVGKDCSLLFGGYGLPPSCSLGDRIRNTSLINIVSEILLRSGMETIIVHEGEPLHLETLPEPVKIIRNWKDMLLDRSFSMILFLDQKQCNAGIKGITVNRRFHFKTEIGLLMLIAGHFGVPTVFVSGCSDALHDAMRINRKIPVRAGFYSQKDSKPVTASLKHAINSFSGISPVTIRGRVTLSIQLQNNVLADKLVRIPGIKKTGPAQVQMTSSNILEVYKLYSCLGMALQSCGFGR